MELFEKSKVKVRAPRNRTLTLTQEEIKNFRNHLLRLTKSASVKEIEDRIIHQDLFEGMKYLPAGFVDLLFIDPPYNLTKTFGSNSFKVKTIQEYAEWMETWLSGLVRILKPTASIYICGDWNSSTAIQQVAGKYFKLRNRITWEREKGRGAKSNWKNCSEDIWFCTMSEKYTFNVEAVRIKKKVIAPYTDESGKPKDWVKSKEGNFRLTHPSNLWTDITVPYWSMPENTDHPTQKPEKLLAKIILASSQEGDMVLDPFCGSGTTCVVAKKLRRQYVGIEMDETYCCLTEKRLLLSEQDKRIQGYHDGVFWERNQQQ